ncbi:MAG: FG-GAP-like repeat-containing protein, partial [Lutibacter sp.]|nr:FG-GAP-like repeat-containing protein [Lutibacter sp.]
MRSLFVLWAFWCCLSGCTKKTTDLPPHFQKIPAGKSGLSFNNSLQHDLQTSFNLFDYDYFYNGAGVGVEDLNNDGLKDIFFCGNQVPNKLFLNKGGLVFEDVSDHAGINTGKYWANGVSFADVNQDGWMDIYVSQGGPHTRAQRGNLLYINQQNMTFKEQAHEVGLDDQGISTQSAFFDYDKDGDLDCVVMNENAYYGVDPARFYQLLSDKEKLEKNSSHLYRNEGGIFVSVTEAAGLLKPSFGLGLCVGDINNDSWPDIYIANDYYVPDALYINNQDGSFTDRIKERTQQVSFYGMGLDIADINNDNLEDIFVLDMASTDHVRSKTLMASMNVPRFHFLTQTLGLQHQYMYNSLQLNLGNNQFHNIAQLTGMSKTDWSWAGLIFDTDHDSQEDVYVTNGYRRYALDNDAKTNIVKAKQQYKGKVPLAVKERIYNELPSEKLSNILYKNLGELRFKDQTETANLQDPSFSNGAAYADLDNDGDLDIVVNNIDAEAFLYRNNAVENKLGNFLKIIPKGQQSESFAKVRISFDGLNKTKESKRVRGYLSSVDNSLHFGLGNTTSVDSLEIRWPSGKVEKRYNIQANTTLVLQEKEALKGIEEATETSYRFEASTEHLHHKHVENDFNDFKKEGLLPYKQSTLGPSMAKGDVNKDGRTDLYIGGASGTGGALYLQTDKGFNKVAQAAFEA